MTLNQIHTPSDVQKLNQQQLNELSHALRKFVIESVLESGGHFAANLGVIELTVALFHTLNFDKHKLIWDVGHQSYPHKAITGRKSLLNTIRSLNGLSGFPKINESQYDHFGTGHSSTALSAAMGMATFNKLNNKKEIAVAVIGDGAFTAGLTFEALNNLWDSQLNVWIILNDNQIGIDPNTGALNSHLKANHSKQLEQFYQFFGANYHGPIDGHNLEQLIPALQQLKTQNGPQLLHIKTVKGKGFPEAEKEQTKWHSATKFVKIDGTKDTNSHQSIKWQDAFGKILLKIAENRPEIIGITPAMPSSCGMQLAMDKFPARFFDVGIAEQHALTFAAGFATSGARPFVNIYSSFLQRAYDQWIHDVALQNLPVTLCIDRAGLVGEDGPTHHGAFDISFLRCVPNQKIAAPKDAEELAIIMNWSLNEKGPVAIRYPKGNIPDPKFIDQYEFSEIRQELSAIFAPKIISPIVANKPVILSTGHATNLAIQGNSQKIGHIHLPFVHPNAYPQIQEFFPLATSIITIEDGSLQGGWGMGISAEIQIKMPNLLFKNLGIPHQFITHGNNQELYEMCGYSPIAIEKTIQELLA